MPRESHRAPAQMKDVAERAGVSITTVSHIVNNTRDVAPETRERVLAAMRELRFYKNAFGRRLARGRSDSFGLIISDLENPFFAEIIKSFEQAVLASGCDVLLFSTSYDPVRAARAVHRLIENKVQGVAVMTSQLDAALVEEIVAAGIPVVMLDAGKAAPGRSNIQVDYAIGAQEAATHLRELGHSHAVFITGPGTRVSAAAYRDSILAALEHAGIEVSVIREAQNTVDGGEQAMSSLIADGIGEATAVLCGNDLAAIGAIRALTAAGVRVPEDISVIGADDIAFARFISPDLTTIRVPRDQLGQLAAEALSCMALDKRGLFSNYSLDTHLVVRASTGPASRSTAAPRRRRPARGRSTVSA